jgi:hypothetical protein
MFDSFTDGSMKMSQTSVQPRSPVGGDSEVSPKAQGSSATKSVGTPNVLAIASIIGAFTVWPAGLVLGMIARRKLRARGEGGEDLATIGIVTSASIGVLEVLGLVVAFVVCAGVMDEVNRVTTMPERLSEDFFDRFDRLQDSMEKGSKRAQDSMEEESKRMLDSHDEQSKRMLDSFDEQSKRMLDTMGSEATEGFERHGEKMMEDFQRRSEQMDQDFQRRSDKVMEDFRRRTNQTDRDGGEGIRDRGRRHSGQRNGGAKLVE